MHCKVALSIALGGGYEGSPLHNKASNSKSKTGLRRHRNDFQAFLHEYEQIVPRVKEHVAS